MSEDHQRLEQALRAIDSRATGGKGFHFCDRRLAAGLIARAGSWTDEEASRAACLAGQYGKQLPSDLAGVPGGDTPLHMAAKADAAACIVALLAHGADREARNASGLRPIDVARQYGRLAAVEALS